jgi:hypothetical protein
MSDEDKQKFMAFVSSEECDGIAQSDHWETVKRHWLATTQSIVNKIDLLNTDSFDTYVEQMCPAKFNVQQKCIQQTNKHLTNNG